MVCVRYQPVTSCAHVQAGRLHYISTRVNFILSLFIICKKGKRTNDDTVGRLQGTVKGKFS